MLKEWMALIRRSGLQTSNLVFMLIPSAVSLLACFLSKTITAKITLICLALILASIVFCHVIGRVFVNLSIASKTDKSEVFLRNQEVPNLDDKILFDEREEEFFITSSVDKNKIYYYLRENTNVKSNNYIMLLHGFSGSHKSINYFSKLFYDLGYNIITMDLRGHGKSKANYIGMGILDSKDLLDVLKDFTEKNKECNIVLFGVSMGAATVLTSLNLNLPKQVKCVIEDSGYTSVKDEFKYQIANIFDLPKKIIYIANPYVKRKAKYSLFDKSSIDGVKKSKYPILFIHGIDDKIVPEKMVDELYENCNSEKQMIKFKARHLESAYMYKDRYCKVVNDFIKENL